MRFVRFCLAAGFISLCPSFSKASLIASDSFAYPSGQSLSSVGTGGTGFSGGWGSSPGAVTTVAGSLTYPGLVSTGNSVVTDPTAGTASYPHRSLSQPVGAPGTSLWVGFLIQPQNANNTFYYDGLAVEGGTGASVPGVFIGKSSDGAGGDVDWLIENSGGGGQAQSSNVAASTGTTAYLVVELSFTSGNTAISLYVDPIIGQPLPSTPSAFKDDTDLGVNFGLTLDTNSPAQFDEVRVGDTFADIAPVPEPASAGAIACACIGLLARRRRAHFASRAGRGSPRH